MLYIYHKNEQEPCSQATAIIIPYLHVQHINSFLITWFIPRLTSFLILKVARPGFSLTIPTLFENEIQRCLKRNRKSSYTYL